MTNREKIELYRECYKYLDVYAAARESDFAALKEAEAAISAIETKGDKLRRYINTEAVLVPLGKYMDKLRTSVETEESEIRRFYDESCVIEDIHNQIPLSMRNGVALTYLLEQADSGKSIKDIISEYEQLSSAATDPQFLSDVKASEQAAKQRERCLVALGIISREGVPEDDEEPVKEEIKEKKKERTTLKDVLSRDRIFK